jgi:hypothetical protein
MIKPELAGKIDGAMLSNDINKDEAQILHEARISGVPYCLGEYDGFCPDCQRQDLEVCKLCSRLSPKS